MIYELIGKIVIYGIFLIFASFVLGGMILVAYYGFNRWLRSCSFCWRVGFMVIIQRKKDGREYINKEFKDNNGKKYKIIEVK